MRTPHLLRASGNVQRMKQNLVNVVDANAIQAIQSAIESNVTQMYSLGKHHYQFAVRLHGNSWRQKISRLYYAAYSFSRAVRFAESGEFSTEVGDHKKVEAIPDAFPNNARYKNRLGILRDDRNLCDYDHTGIATDLVISVPDAVDLVRDFMNDTKANLLQKGITI